MKKYFIFVIIPILLFILLILFQKLNYLRETSLPAEPVEPIEKTNCFPDAVKTTNPKFCESIYNETLKKECRDLVSFVKTNCDNRKLEEKFFCVSLLRQDIRYCNCIDVEWYRYTCLANMDNNPDICLNIKDIYHRGGCLKDIAINTQNENICEKIKNKDWKTMCVAVISRDQKSCRSIDDQEIRNQCESMMEEIKE